MDAYQQLVKASCRQAMRSGYRAVYFRFASHVPLVGEDEITDVCRLRADQGFETFVAETQAVVRGAGREAV